MTQNLLCSDVEDGHLLGHHRVTRRWPPAFIGD